MSTENRRYYWLKLKENFFTDKRIKRLRKIYYDGVETDFIRRSRKSRQIKNNQKALQCNTTARKLQRRYRDRYRVTYLKIDYNNNTVIESTITDIQKGIIMRQNDN